MTELTEVLSQWGAAGVVAIAAGWVLWDSYKKNHEMQKWMRDQVTKGATQRSDGFDGIKAQITSLMDENKKLIDNLTERVTSLEEKFDKHHPDITTLESARLAAISHIAPAIHTIINDGLTACNCDHIAVALLHNGTVSLSGIPYVKFGIIAEKYKPIRCPQDIDLISKYKDEDIMSHNRLPNCIVQNRNVEFSLVGDSTLIEIDPRLYKKCNDRGIKRISFEAIRDIHGLTTGFIVAYKFDDAPINMDSVHKVSTAIEKLYQEMLLALS